jgi:glutathione S-transferase
MILIGQFDSPFVRRVAVALNLYGLPYRHRPWSTFADADKIAAHNPLRRVPTLVLDDGEVLIESLAILDYLDDRAAPAEVLMPRSGPERRAALKVFALASGLCDKMVALIYERVLHEATSEIWTERCRTQIVAVLDVLEQDRAARDSRWWFGGRIGHPDIAVACAMRFLSEAHPAIAALGRWPALGAHAAACEGFPAFKAVTQAFIPPAR